MKSQKKLPRLYLLRRQQDRQKMRHNKKCSSLIEMEVLHITRHDDIERRIQNQLEMMVQTLGRFVSAVVVYARSIFNSHIKCCCFLLRFAFGVSVIQSFGVNSMYHTDVIDHDV